MFRNRIEYSSKITCPVCGFPKEEPMPAEGCQNFYQCVNCRNVIRPKEGDRCVYCSYGTVKCPPVQQDKNCG
ncbi:MAG TPA: GDCCVxC domain-containing (seleno)protein [Prolixibacteraceae bacterium]